jgi:hypothetical protein
MIAIEMGTMESFKTGAGIAIPEVSKQSLMGLEVPATALMTETAGVSNPSAMTQLAPNRVQTNNPSLKTLCSRIQAPLTGRPLRSEVESNVSDTVSISESAC